LEINEDLSAEDFDKYLGVLAKDLPEGTVQGLLDAGYSVSPKSGRIRRRFRRKETKPKFYKRKKFKKNLYLTFWIIIIILFLVSLIIILKETDFQTAPKKKTGFNNKNTFKFPNALDYKFALSNIFTV